MPEHHKVFELNSKLVALRDKDKTIKALDEEIISLKTTTNSVQAACDEAEAFNVVTVEALDHYSFKLLVLQEAAETAKKALLPPPAAPTIVHAAPASNLPKFGLPDFGGDFIDYLPFMNVFNVEVDTNPHFSDATKFNFLYERPSKVSS